MRLDIMFTLSLPADFYGQGRTTGNLELLARFYDKYPQYVDKTFLSVKVNDATCNSVLFFICSANVFSGPPRVSMT